VDALTEAGYPVHLANTAALVQYSGLKYSDVDSDARWLAQLLRRGLLAEGYIYPKEDRAVRDLLRRRSRLVQQHTANLLAIQNLFARDRGRSLSANEVKRLTPEGQPFQGANALKLHEIIFLAPATRESRLDNLTVGKQNAMGNHAFAKIGGDQVCWAKFASVTFGVGSRVFLGTGDPI
jgi:transposase